ncbi:MAG: FliH/SctL family protein [Planctomycetota bacterium]|jgi:flagellar assembly protein FliH
MPVIKKSNPKRTVDHAIVLDLGDLAAEAKRIRDEAREEADRLLARARSEAEREAASLREAAKKEGHDAGFVAGRHAGLAEGREAAIAEMQTRLEELVREWSGALAQWQSQRQAMLRQAREDVLVLAFELGRRVVHRWTEIDPSVVEDQLREALSLVSRPTSVEVAVDPADRSLLEEVLDAPARRRAVRGRGCTGARLTTLRPNRPSAREHT